MKRYLTQNRRRLRSRDGASAVEFAVIAPLMIAFTFGLVEVGRIMLVKQSATHATREGARMAVKPTATTLEVVQRVEEELALMGIDSANIVLQPTAVEDAEPGSPVTVQVDIGIDSVSWVPGVFSFGVANITAQSSMRRESTD
jgi:Flp pilus assembly pilin Flp